MDAAVSHTKNRKGSVDTDVPGWSASVPFLTLLSEKQEKKQHAWILQNFFLTFKDCIKFYNSSKEATLSRLTQKSNKTVLLRPGHEKVEQLLKAMQVCFGRIIRVLHSVLVCFVASEKVNDRVCSCVGFYSRWYKSASSRELHLHLTTELFFIQKRRKCQRI